jgi:hypothetical protein
MEVVNATNVVIATIEERDPLIADPAIGWTSIGAESELSADLTGDGTAVWSGQFVPPPGQGRARRLRISEFELQASDNRSGESGAGFIDTKRLVYADVVDLD